MENFEGPLDLSLLKRYLTGDNPEAKFVRVDNSVAIGPTKRQHKAIGRAYLPLLDFQGREAAHDSGTMATIPGVNLLICDHSVGLSYAIAGKAVDIFEDPLIVESSHRDTCKALDPLVGLAVAELGFRRFALRYSPFSLDDVEINPEYTFDYRIYNP